jgi:serine/threonine protein kinase
MDAGDTASPAYGSRGYKSPEMLQLESRLRKKLSAPKSPSAGDLKLGNLTSKPSGDLPADGQLLRNGFRLAKGLPKLDCYEWCVGDDEKRYEINRKIYAGMPAEIKQVVKACLEVKVKKRPSIAAILQMDLFSLPVHTLQDRWAGISAGFSPLGQLLCT